MPLYRIVCLLPNTGGTKRYDHPLYHALVDPQWSPAGPLLDVAYLVSQPSARTEVTLCLVLESTASYAVVSPTLVLDDLPAP